MRLISSRMTFVNKRVFPVFWFGFLAFFECISLLAVVRSARGPPAPVLLIPIGMGIFGFFLFRKLVWDLADEVYDCGDHLLAKRSGLQERIELSKVINVSWSTMSNPERVTLTLRDPVAFGREITFTPPLRLNPFSRSPIVDDLIDRIDVQRCRGSSARS
jgi:hypothetical protein